MKLLTNRYMLQISKMKSKFHLQYLLCCIEYYSYVGVTIEDRQCPGREEGELPALLCPILIIRDDDNTTTYMSCVLCAITPKNLCLGGFFIFISLGMRGYSFDTVRVLILHL